MREFILFLDGPSNVRIYIECTGGGCHVTPLVFDWDEGNAAHVARHDVTTDEAEQVVNGDRQFIAFQDRSGEFRRVIVGRTHAGRALSVAYVIRGGRIRVVTAFPASPKRRRLLDKRGN